MTARQVADVLREAAIFAHDFDDDGCCTKCGFDGAEWHWWKRSTYEGRAQPGAKMPRCKVPNEKSIGGHHASPRVHLRRGHIRRLPTMNVWVQPCVVGDKTRGMVHKDYRVEATQ